MWKKCIKAKHRVKLDKIYNSYWIRKFLNKFTNNGKNFKTEILLYKILCRIKNIFFPKKYFFKVLFKAAWRVTTQLRRMGKFFHNIPTYITFPRIYGHGILKLKKAIKNQKTDKSFLDTVYQEFYNMILSPKDSLSLKLKKTKYLLVQKNKAYTHFRWR